MPSKRPTPDPPELLRVLVELHIDMAPEDSQLDWSEALTQDFLPQLPGTATLLATTVLRRCAGCEVWFAVGIQTARKDKAYHSTKCRMRAFRERHTTPLGGGES